MSLIKVEKLAVNDYEYFPNTAEFVKGVKHPGNEIWRARDFGGGVNYVPESASGSALRY
ncbi:hypothetical protein OSCI_3320027 [Kamptonema sp. PCC 6506]|nr:hypothetical protein OSCI_3320027 [Kamptonema sp. PCC 6506]